MRKPLIIAAALIAAVLAGVALLRLTVFTPAPPQQNTEDLRAEFRVRDGQGGMRRYQSGSTRADLEAAIGRELLERAGPDETDDARQAAGVLATRADLLFDPDMDRWRERVRAAGGTVPPIDDAYTQMWEGSVEPFTNPRIDVSGIRVEPVDPDREFPQTQPGTICMRRGVSDVFSSSYPALHANPGAADGRETLELFIPVRVRDAEGADLGGTISFVVGRSSKDDPWRELDMFLYFGQDAFSRTLRKPPF